MFKRILARLNVFLPFLDFALAFGFRLEPQDENFGSLYQRMYPNVKLGKEGASSSFGNPAFSFSFTMFC